MGSELRQLIIERIGREGPITFADYMRMALYEPGYGYYVTGADRIGWEGDYYTSTDVSSFFAHCMGRQLEQLWEKSGRPGRFVVLEQGAGRGHLAEGVRAWAEEEAPDFNVALDYRVEDIGGGEDAARGRGQAQGPHTIPPRPLSLQDDGDGSLEYTRERASTVITEGQAQGPHTTSPRPLSLQDDGDGSNNPSVQSLLSYETPFIEPSVILSNELVDAFPVHVVETYGKGLYEVFVGVEQGRFCEVLDEPSSVEVANYLDRFKILWQSFGDGWRAEINLDALRWMERVAQIMERGYILTIDYGDKAKALYTRNRRRGTLACYAHHQMLDHPYLRPGQQDITAHVNFSALIEEGRRYGFRLSAFTTQRQWLEGLGIYDELERRRVNEFSEADTARATDRGQVALLQWYNLRQRVAALTDAAGMGNFKVLLQSRSQKGKHINDEPERS
jgi:SAM-dependent MidA family methyltransferase